jgi:hypothetical protein
MRRGCSTNESRFAMSEMSILAAHGMQLFPVHSPVNGQCSCGKPQCNSPAKHPRISNWQVEATNETEKLRAWWRQWRGCNWGIATGVKSGVIVLDVDPRHGGDETLAARERDHGPLPLTWEVITGSGGRHLYFRHPGTGPIANSVGILGPGLDIRGDGGYAVAPGSMHPCGRPYTISVDGHPDEVALAELPGWIQSGGYQYPGGSCEPRGEHSPPGLIARAPMPPSAWLTLLADPIEDGRRNATITRLAGLLLRRFVDPEIALELCIIVNAARCKPPLDEGEVIVAVTSIINREAARRERQNAA